MSVVLREKTTSTCLGWPPTLLQATGNKAAYLSETKRVYLPT